MFIIGVPIWNIYMFRPFVTWLVQISLLDISIKSVIWF